MTRPRLLSRRCSCLALPLSQVTYPRGEPRTLIHCLHFVASDLPSRPDRIENRSVRGSTVSVALPWDVNHKDLQGDFDATIEMINELTAQLARLQLHRERESNAHSTDKSKRSVAF